MKRIIEKIEAFDKICIFRHIHPDIDATGSQLAIYYFIKDNFPNKKVLALGFEKNDILDFIEEATDEFISDSLAIVVDTSNRERVDDNRFINAKYIIKIDHHPAFDNYGNLNIINEKAAATCELLAELLFELDDNYIIGEDCAKYLYMGILTDTLNFKTSSTTSNTLLIASKLAKKGIDIADITFNTFALDYKSFKLRSVFRSLLKIEDNFGYIILKKHDLKKIDLSGDIARTFISEFSMIKELKIWVVITQNDNNLYDGSLRCQKEYSVNEIARKYGGGGHKCAAGIKNLTLHDLNALLTDLKRSLK